ncbi:phosphopantetheine-binding protein [Micromonospora sp. NPDC049301]|uniref:phosphopantetheine-binding protein n=1 Tax=Micromonospora sp. NPDC049301 TaxID=3155723 RepID=UPI00343540FF
MSIVHSARDRRDSFFDSVFEAPEGPREAAVARIVADVLNLDRVGRSDGFYDFGATSLHAVRICARIKEVLDVTARPDLLFHSDTLAEFVATLGAPSGEVAP